MPWFYEVVVRWADWWGRLIRRQRIHVTLIPAGEKQAMAKVDVILKNLQLQLEGDVQSATVVITNSVSVDEAGNLVRNEPVTVTAAKDADGNQPKPIGIEGVQDESIGLVITSADDVGNPGPEVNESVAWVDDVAPGAAMFSVASVSERQAETGSDLEP